MKPADRCHAPDPPSMTGHDDGAGVELPLLCTVFCRPAFGGRPCPVPWPWAASSGRYPANSSPIFPKGRPMSKEPGTLSLTMVALVFLAAVLSACHTTAGAGEDISKTGQAIEKSAEKHAP